MKTERKDLSIRKKIIISAVVIVVIFTSVIYYISNFIILKSYSRLENEVAQINLSRTDNIFKNVINELDTKLSDWAFWDDTYAYIEDRNIEYEESNLQNISISSIKVNAMVFLNNKGEIVNSKVIDLDSITEIISSKDELVSYIEKNRSIFQFKKIDESFKGVASLKDGKMILVAKPILTSSKEGPVHGTLIWGKFINRDVLDNISSLAQLPINFYDYDSSALTEDLILAKENLSSENKYFINPTSKNIINGYFLLRDIHHTPISIFKITDMRNIYREGVSTVNFFILIISIIQLFIATIFFIFVEIEILSRFDKLNNDFDNIIKNLDFSKKIIVEKKDEIGNFAKAINITLENLYLAQKSEEEANEQKKIATEKLKAKLDELSELNRLMIGRELKMVELKREIDKSKGSIK